MSQKLKGFTLIELLVVIAIIGVLATVVIGAVGSARSKGQDAAVASNLANARVVAEVFADKNGSYNTGSTNVCSATDNDSLYANVLAALKVTVPAATAFTPSNALTTGFNTSTKTGYCYSSATQWYAAAPLRTLGGQGGNTLQYHCVDSTGNSRISAGVTNGVCN